MSSDGQDEDRAKCGANGPVPGTVCLLRPGHGGDVHEGANSSWLTDAALSCDAPPRTLAAWATEIASRWGTSEYNAAFQARVAAGDPLVRADHDLKHLLKSLGALAGVTEECDHTDVVAHAHSMRETAENKWADTFIVLLGLADHWPGGAIDAQAVVARRFSAKFPKRSGE